MGVCFCCLLSLAGFIFNPFPLMLSYVLKFFDFILPSSLSTFIRSRFDRDRVQKASSPAARVHLSSPVIEVLLQPIESHSVDQPRLSQSDLISAIKQNNLELVKELLSLENINPNGRSKDGTLPLFAAIDTKNYEMVQALMRCDRIDLSLKNGDGRTIGYRNLLGLIYYYIKFRSTRRLIEPLTANMGWIFSLSAQKDTSTHCAHLKSARCLHEMAVLFQLKEIFHQIPNSLCKYNHFLQDVLKDGLGSPDRIWQRLEHVWTSLSDIPQHFQGAIESLISDIHTGAIADAQQIANSIKNNKPVSFIVFKSDHIMSMSIQGNVLILTNLGGSVDLHTGKFGHNIHFAGKRIVRLDEQAKALFTADFVKSLQDCQSGAMKKIFALPVQGVITYPGQKRGNCGASHPKSIWEDQLLLAQARYLCPNRPEHAFEALFKDGPKNFHFYTYMNKKWLPFIEQRCPGQKLLPINSIQGLKDFMDRYGNQLPKTSRKRLSKKIKNLEKIQYPVITHEDLEKTEFNTAYHTFKQLTLAIRQSVLNDFKQDSYAQSFLADQIQLNSSLGPHAAEQLALDVYNRILGQANETIDRMQQRRK